MSEQQWHILVVEDDEQLNQSIVTSLHKDGYSVQGVRSGAEAIRMLWSEEYDVVIGDLKTPGADGFEMLQWLRAFRPNTRMIMVAPASSNSASTRTHALEAGVVSYLEKPLDLHLLKEELRRLLQQTGFSASLDSFDLLDVIQIINMSRKNIALLVNTGLEERGILRFQGGELIWAEYGTLHGEEAFFALAAHKNGMVTHQLWNEQITPNVTQPLSRLIFQALQYRTKYADTQQPTGEQEAVPRAPALQEVGDDSPFVVVTEELDDAAVAKVAHAQVADESADNGTNSKVDKEWWEQTDKMQKVGNSSRAGDLQTMMADSANMSGARGQSGQSAVHGNSPSIVPSTVRKTPASQRVDRVGQTDRTDLPSWLTDQPTKSDLPVLRPASLSGTAHLPAAPVAPVTKSSPAEWQPPSSPPSSIQTQTARKQATGPQKSVVKAREIKETGRRPTSSPEWQGPIPERTPSSPLPNEALPDGSASRRTSGTLSPNERRNSGALTNTGKMGLQRPDPARRNYQALVAALQTVGYSIPGFIASAVVGLDGQPIAQVTIDDLDISPLCSYFSTIVQGVLQSLDSANWGSYEETVITSTDRLILLRLIGNNRDAFQVLVTTRESNLAESLEAMENVEAAITAALVGN